jgi:cell division protein FtsB
VTPPTTRTERNRLRDMRRTRFLLLGSVVLAAGILVAWFPAGALYRQHASLAASHSQLQELKQQDAALTQEQKQLSSSSEISRIARQQYQLVSPGQQAYEVLPPAGSATAASPYSGDPGNQAPVAPSAASELASGNAAPASESNEGANAHKSSVHRKAASDLYSRMLHALEFWR